MVEMVLCRFQSDDVRLAFAVQQYCGFGAHERLLCEDPVAYTCSNGLTGGWELKESLIAEEGIVYLDVSTGADMSKVTFWTEFLP
jgi:hypothetical protein